MTTEEKNKVIFDYCGFVINDAGEVMHPDPELQWMVNEFNTDYAIDILMHSMDYIDSKDFSIYNHLQFHKDWRWLIPIVQRLAKTPDGDGYEFRRQLDAGLFLPIETVFEYTYYFIEEQLRKSPTQIN